MRCNSVRVAVYSILRGRTELISFELISIKYYQCVCLYSCLIYPAYKSNLFCALLYCITYSECVCLVADIAGGKEAEGV